MTSRSAALRRPSAPRRAALLADGNEVQPLLRKERAIAVTIERDDLTDRLPTDGTVATARPAHWYDRAGRDVPRQPEHAPRDRAAPERQRDQRRADPRRARGEEQVLHGRIDRAVTARRHGR